MVTHSVHCVTVFLVLALGCELSGCIGSSGVLKNNMKTTHKVTVKFMEEPFSVTNVAVFIGKITL